MSLDQIKQEIRLKAEQQRAAAPQMAQLLAQLDTDDPPPPDFNSRVYSVAELTQFHYQTFVEIAYQALLKRPPEPEGLKAFLGRLALGHGKIAVLGSLRYSAEGRRAAVKVRGLSLRYTYYLLSRLPLIGYGMDLLGALFSLPKFIRHQNQSDTYFAARFQGNTSELQRQNDVLRALRGEFRQQSVNLEKLIQRLTQLEQIQPQMEARIHTANTEIDEIDKRIITLEKVTHRLSQFEQLKPHLEKHLQAIGVRDEEINARIEQLKKTIHEAVVMREEEINAHTQQLKETIRETVAVREEEINGRIEQLKETIRPSPELALLRHDVLAMRHWLTTIQTTIGAIEQQENAERAELDALTADLINRLANTPQTKHAVRTSYLDILRDTHTITPESPLLDVGSGRGEWLNLLREQGYSAKGVEQNPVLAEQCRSNGLDVSSGDLMDHLKRTSTASLGAISALQIINSFSLSQLVAFLNEAKRTLVGQGVLLIEAIEPGNITWNYHDPNANNALPPELIKHLMESRGYIDVQLLPQIPSGSSTRIAFAIMGRTP